MSPMRRRGGPVPEPLRHRIVPTDTGWQLQTHYGYVLKTFATRADAQAYYAWHCPVE